jgi:hypothetical protein
MTTWRLPLLCTRPDLHPARALLSPTWLVALAVLAVNDHILKGAGLLPGGVTGKLSDLAGMIVAPALLAALLRVRSRRGLLLCHAAVAAVFAGINLSPALADAWSWLMGLVYPWHVTVDPTDLLALPALALGWRALVPAMERPLPALSPALPRLAESAALLTGTFLCVATSPPREETTDEGDWGEFGESGTTDVDYQDLDADVYVHNGTDRDITVRARDLRPDIQLDCIAAEEDPGLYLSEALFGAGQTWTMPPSTNAPVRDLSLGTRECYAVRVEGDAFKDPILLFWRAEDISVAFIDGDIDDPGLHTDGAVLLADDGDGRLVVAESRSEIVYPIDLTPPADAVRPADDADRLAWSDPPFGEHLLTEVDVGPDGCVAITVDDQAARWYLCVPQGAFPFAVGQWVRIDDRFGAVEVVRIPDPQDPIEVPAVQLTVSRGETLPSIQDVVLAAKADYDATIAPDLVCGTLARPNEISARLQGSPVETGVAGDVITIATQTSELKLWVATAEDRLILDADCAEGTDELGPDIEIAALVTAIEP